MTYEAWRISYQSSEQAAKAAYGALELAWTELDRMRERLKQVEEFVAEVSKQTPEKPDYWSSCGQCSRNQSEAEDLMETALATGGSHE